MKPGHTPKWYRFFFMKTNFSVLSLVLLVIGGLFAYSSMSKESTPDLEIPQAIVATAWWGASPELIEKEVTIPIERKIRSIKGIRRVKSGSQNSVSIVSVEFVAEADMQESMQGLRDKVAEAQSLFPSEVNKSTIEKIAVSDIPIMTLSLNGRGDEVALNEAAKDLQTRLMRIPGMKKVSLSGGRPAIVQIMLRPERLAGLGIGTTVVSERIEAANRDTPWGGFDNEDYKSDFRLQGRFSSIEELRELPIARIGEGRVVRLGDLATIKKGMMPEVSQTSISQDGAGFARSISMALYKSPGRDTVAITKKVRVLLAELPQRTAWPSWVHAEVSSDESKQIMSGLKTVFDNAWQAMLAVFVVLIFFLTWREALIASLAIPVTFLGTLLVLWQLGHTLNELVVVGLVLALGLLVDDFILMMEGMHEALFVESKSLQDAVKHTLATYAIPSLSGSLTTITIFLPLMAIGGVDGKFIRIIPITTAIALCISYFVSVFVAVPLSALLLKQSTLAGPTRIDRASARASTALYTWLKEHAVSSKRRALTWFAGILAVFGIAIVASTLLPSQLYPKGDGINLGITVELPPSTKLKQSKQVAYKLGEILRNKNYFAAVTKYVGNKSPLAVDSIAEMLTETDGAHLMGFSAQFVPRSERPMMGFEYVEALRQELEAALETVAGASLIFTPQTGGSTSEDPVQIEIYGPDMQVLRRLSRATQQALAQIPGAVDVRDNLGSLRNAASFTPKREALDFYGVSQGELASQVRLAMSGQKIGKMRRGSQEEDLQMYLGMAWPSQNGELGPPTQWAELASIEILSQQQKRIPFPALVRSHADSAASSILHKNGKRVVTVMAKTQGATPEEVLLHMQPRLQELQKTWPRGYTFAIAGEAESSDETYASTTKTLFIGIAVVYGILVLLFGSYVQPFIIILSVPFAMIGTFGGFFLTWTPLSFPAMIGIIALVGIVVNDSIVMISTMNLHREAGLSLPEAAARGAADRLRPILSTTITTIVGLVPLALSSPTWMPLCSAIIYGLLAATAFSLILVPCLFLLLPSSEP